MAGRAGARGEGTVTGHCQQLKDWKKAEERNEQARERLKIAAQVELAGVCVWGGGRGAGTATGHCQQITTSEGKRQPKSEWSRRERLNNADQVEDSRREKRAGERDYNSGWGGGGGGGGEEVG